MEHTVANKGLRLQNYLIDMAIVWMLYLLIKFIISSSGVLNYLLFPLLYFLYYYLMELTYGQTIGKRITKTIIIHKEGRKVNKQELLIRTLFRFVVFDTLSFWLGSHVGMHDWYSNTRVVSKANAPQILDAQHQAH